MIHYIFKLYTASLLFHNHFKKALQGFFIENKEYNNLIKVERATNYFK